MKMNFTRTMEPLVKRHGAKEALINIERQRRYTYAELQLLTNRIVNMMRERLQLRRGDVYLSFLANDSLSLMHTWTALKGEAAAAWTNLYDAFEEHCWQVDFIRPKVVFIENALLDRYFDMLRERGVRVVCMDPPPVPREGLDCFWDLLEGVSDADPGVESDVYKDVLIYRFTGGTTGKSKCAAYTTDNWLACRDTYLIDREQEFAADTRFLHFAPLSHGAGILLLPTLFRGGCTLTQNIPDLKLWCHNAAAEKVTATLMLPTMMYRLLDMPEAKEHDLSSVRMIGYGGAPISPGKLERLQARFGPIFIQSYGSTECLQPVTLLTKEDHVAGLYLGSAGTVTPGVELRIVDEHGKEVEPGATGEIWIRSRAVIPGYYNNPEGTASEFADGFWKSGDLGYLNAQGYLHIVDRKKDMIISGGFNIYAVEVEAALNSHPAVANSVVVGVPHDEWGEAVHAEVVLVANARVSAEELIEHVKSHLGRFKAPKSITIAEMLPTSAVGKVLRRQVRDKYWKDQARKIA